MNFEKYKVFSLIDEKPILFKHPIGWLAYWKGYIMPGEMALIICAIHFWKNHPSKEVKRVANTLTRQCLEHDWFAKDCPLPLPLMSVNSNTPLRPENIDFLYYYEFNLIHAGVIEAKYTHEEVYSWFVSMLTEKV